MFVQSSGELILGDIMGGPSIKAGHFGKTNGGAYLAKPDSAKSESAVQERAKPYFAKPGT